MISANREGLISLSGYLAFQLIGMGIGRDLYSTLVYQEPKQIKDSMKEKDTLEKRHS